MPTSKEQKSTAIVGLIVLIVIAALLIAVALVFLARNYFGADASGERDPVAATESYLHSLPMVTSDGSRLFIDEQPVGSDGRLLYEALSGKWSYAISTIDVTGRKGVSAVLITCPDFASMASAVREETARELAEALETSDKSDIYNEDDSFRPEAVDAAYRKALETVCAQAEQYSVTVSAKLMLERAFGIWNVANAAELTNTFDEHASQLREIATDNIEYISKVYIIPESATAAPVPNPVCFGETEDPAVVSALLENKYAKNLLKGQSLVWNPGIPLLPGSTISYYLDESILMIQWQQAEEHMVATFGETVVADGSQIRKKIAGDSFGDMHFETTTQFADDVHAVLAVGGDFYNHGRNCGIVVQNREIGRFDLTSCDVCYIDSAGDMLFSYRNQFQTPEEAAAFVSDNDVLFSLSFGPVLIDDGQDVTPSSYTWGEVNDTYARAALGMLGEHHYLTMNLNCGSGETYGYATLRQAADVMIRRGCLKAYTLDGGQTATTVVNGVLKNPVQFGYEKAISDILYFASAVPND